MHQKTIYKIKILNIFLFNIIFLFSENGQNCF